MEGTDKPVTAEDHRDRGQAALQLAEKFVAQQHWARVAAFSALASAHFAAAEALR